MENFPEFNKVQAAIFVTKLCIPKLKVFARTTENSWLKTKQGNAVAKIEKFFDKPGNHNVRAAYKTTPYGTNPALLANYILNDI